MDCNNKCLPAHVGNQSYVDAHGLALCPLTLRRPRTRRTSPLDQAREEATERLVPTLRIRRLLRLLLLLLLLLLSQPEFQVRRLLPLALPEARPRRRPRCRRR